jgi:hypothetical protein
VNEQEIQSLLGDWKDPFPAPIIKEHEGFSVLRDDLIGVGSKARFADFFISTSPAKEFVFGSSPRWGYAQISLAYLCQKYGKTFTLFLAKGKRHPYTEKAISYGANVIDVPMGFLAVTQARAREYVAEKPQDRFLFPIGLEHPTVTASIVRVARELPIVPEYVWVASSSGTLQRGLGLAWPEAKINALQVGHTMTHEQIGQARVWLSPYKFKETPKVTDLTPPFPSAKHYERKLWEPMWLYHHRGKYEDRKKVLFWNVGGEPT